MKRIAVTAGVFLACMASMAIAQNATYGTTSQPIHLIIPNGAGGGTDIAGRLLAEELQDRLGNTVVVENLSAAGGIEGATKLMNATPDGYTIALVPVPHVSMFYLDPERGSDFHREKTTVIAQHDYGQLAIAVVADSPYQTLGDVIGAAGEKPGSITSASSSVLGGGHLTLLQLNEVAGVDLNWVPMEQQGTALSSLLGGHINIIVDGFSELYPQHQAGSLRILAVFGDERRKDAADIPTAKEQGYDVTLSSTRLVIGPAGMPESVVSLLESTIGDLIQNDDAYKASAAQRSVELFYRNSADASALWSSIDAAFEPIIARFRETN